MLLQKYTVFLYLKGDKQYSYPLVVSDAHSDRQSRELSIDFTAWKMDHGLRTVTTFKWCTILARWQQILGYKVQTLLSERREIEP